MRGTTSWRGQPEPFKRLATALFFTPITMTLIASVVMPLVPALLNLGTLAHGERFGRWLEFLTANMIGMFYYSAPVVMGLTLIVGLPLFALARFADLRAWHVDLLWVAAAGALGSRLARYPAEWEVNIAIGMLLGFVFAGVTRRALGLAHFGTAKPPLDLFAPRWVISRRIVAVIVLMWSSWMAAVLAFWINRYRRISPQALEHLSDYYYGGVPSGAFRLAVMTVVVVCLAAFVLGVRDQAAPSLAARKKPATPALTAAQQLIRASIAAWTGIWALILIGFIMPLAARRFVFLTHRFDPVPAWQKDKTSPVLRAALDWNYSLLLGLGLTATVVALVLIWRMSRSQPASVVRASAAAAGVGLVATLWMQLA